jgi:hypothetical protein
MSEPRVLAIDAGGRSSSPQRELEGSIGVGVLRPEGLVFPDE